jgi:hypothetical protein
MFLHHDRGRIIQQRLFHRKPNRLPNLVRALYNAELSAPGNRRGNDDGTIIEAAGDWTPKFPWIQDNEERSLSWREI